MAVLMGNRDKSGVEFLNSRLDYLTISADGRASRAVKSPAYKKSPQKQAFIVGAFWRID
jgi:hypothetical protein